MKKSILVLCVLLPVAAICDIFTGRSFTVCGTNFVFEFEDATVLQANKFRIADDIILTRCCWSNSVIERSSVSEFDGHIGERTHIDPPYARNGIKFPAYFKNHGTNHCLYVSRKLSEAYTNAFAFVDANTNMYAAAMRFVDLMVSGEYERIPSNEVYRLVYQKGFPREFFSKVKDEVISDLKQQKFIRPSILGILPPTSSATDQILDPAYLGISEPVPLMLLPALYWSDYQKQFAVGAMPVIWYEEIWRIAPPKY